MVSWSVASQDTLIWNKELSDVFEEPVFALATREAWSRKITSRSVRPDKDGTKASG
ncbi:unnamed protein product [Penicillium camemberti]|uniref:Str. FM013 n=1 Tax=Penicillium camemberti (strain FM 013) TaxID=1429867 RepID=A0A0G4PLL9_PENC3|nr:unnamed protein product [Penicillium camemberti]